jgi:hypothetical protein
LRGHDACDSGAVGKRDEGHDRQGTLALYQTASAAEPLCGAYAGRNPKTGAATKVKAKMLPFFKVGKELKERVNLGQR